MKKKDFINLAEKITEGTATDAELTRYNTWYNSIHVDFLWDEDLLGNKIEKENLLLKNIEFKIFKNNKAERLLLYKRISIAAAVIMVLGAGLFFYTARHLTMRDSVQGLNAKNDIPAGKNGAMLTLADGRKIELTHADNGKLAEQAGVSITKTSSGQIVYNIENDAQLRKQSNTLSTSNGQKYQLILPDQTKVWLNAASSIKYPSSFTGQYRREVEITGEVYFEVSKVYTLSKERVSFVVITKNQTVEVLGTHFNINSYANEPSVKTTLLEGAVRVSPSNSIMRVSRGHTIAGPETKEPFVEAVVLKPGEQSVLQNGKLRIAPADLQANLAWKNGDFIFNDEPLESIMRQVSRWYNVEIVYVANAPKNFTMGGAVSRSRPISAVLERMQGTGKVTFKMEGRKIYVSQ